MALSRPPAAPTTPPDDDLVVKIVTGFFRGLGTHLAYVWRRGRQDRLVAALYVLLGWPAAILFVLDLVQAFALWRTPAYARPPAIPPFGGHPLPPPFLFGVAVLWLALLILDKWREQRALTRLAAAEVAALATPLTPQEWVLGTPYRRTWQPDPGEWVMVKQPVWYRLTGEHLRTHLIVIAPPGAGKTRSILEPILAFGRRTGAAALVIDAKGDDFAPTLFHLNFDLNHPTASMKLNIWSGRTPREAGERLGEALIPDLSPDKAYFSNNAKDALAGLVAAHHAAKALMPTLRQLLTYLRDSQARADLRALLEADKSTHADALADLQRLDQLADGKVDVLGGLDTALAPLARGEIAELLATDGTGYRIEDLLRQPVRVRFALPVGQFPRIAPILGRLVLAQFTDAVIAPDCNRARLKLAIVDEAHNFVTPAIAKGMAMARSNYGSYILAFQDLAQIPDPTLRENILSVAGNKLIMAGVGEQDADKLSRLFGAAEREYIIHSTTQSSSTNTSRSSASGHHGNQGASRNTATAQSTAISAATGESRQRRLRPDFLPSEIRALPPFHMVIERRDATGEVTPATVVHLDRAVLEQAAIAQDLALYKQVRRREAAQPDWEVLTPATGPAAPAGEETRPAATGADAPTEETDTPAAPPTTRPTQADAPATAQAAGAQEGDGAPAPAVAQCGPPRAGTPTTPLPTIPILGEGEAGPADPGPAAPADAAPPPAPADRLAGLSADDQTVLPQALSEALQLSPTETTALMQQALAQGWSAGHFYALLTECQMAAPDNPAAPFKRRITINKRPRLEAA